MNGYGLRLQLFGLGSDVVLGGMSRPPLSFFTGSSLPLGGLARSSLLRPSEPAAAETLMWEVA